MSTVEKPGRERRDNTSSPTNSGSSRSPYPIRRRRNPAVLIRWIEEHPYNPYPTKAEKHYLAFYAGMTQRQLNDWFANARRNIKKVGYEAWKKKHSGFSAILSGIPLHNTGPNFPIFSGTVPTLAPNVNCKPPTTSTYVVPGPTPGGAINGTHLTINMNGTVPPAMNGTLSHCDVSNGCNSISATTCSGLPTPSPYYPAQEQAISINSSACTLKPVIPIATYTAPTLQGTENMSYAASTIRPLHPSFPLTMPWVPPPLPVSPISGSYKVIVPSKMDCNCAQCQQLQAPTSTALSHGTQLSSADGVQQWSPGEQNSDCTQSSPLAEAPQHSATPNINAAHWNDWQSPQQQPQLSSCAEEDGQALAEESYYEQSPTASVTLCDYRPHDQPKRSLTQHP